MVRSKAEVVRPNEKMVRPNEPAHKPSLLGSKRNDVPTQLLARGRGQRLAELYSSKRLATSNSLIGVGVNSFTRAGSEVLKSIQGQKDYSKGLRTMDNSDVNVDGASFDPLFTFPHARRNSIEDWESSSESIHEENNDDELHFSSEDEDIQTGNENFDNHDHEADENIIEHDNVNEMEISRTIQEDVNGAGSSSTKKNENEKKRARNKYKEIAKLKPNEKLEITFYNNRAVGTNHKVFARHLGIIVRDTNICPVRVRKWDDIGEKEKEHMWTAVTDVFTNESMDTYKEYILGHMRELWTNWRSDLLRYNVTKKKITLEAAYNGKPPDGLDDKDWKWLIKEVYLDEKFKGANKGKKPNLVDVFHATRKKGTSLPNAEMTQKYVAQKVFKSKSRDRVVGFGGGITLKEISGPQPSREELQSKLNEANKQNQILTNRVNTVQEENNALKSRMGSVEDELKVFKDVLLQRLNISIPREDALDLTNI